MYKSSYHVINDPIHGALEFSQEEINWLRPFIDNPWFQRLRHIKQLGLADLIFPGAVHTRFNHSLGCCYVACKIANKIGLSEKDKQIVMIAALLHDIGHGPISHGFEEIYQGVKIKHENWTKLFLEQFQTDLFLNEYHQKNPNMPLFKENLALVTRIIMHREQEKKLLADIVSSQLDADRLDYLLRDSHFCGVSYGEFDFRWLIHCLSIISQNENSRLGINHKGIGVVENYLVARRLMIRNIYFHHKKYASEFLLQELLRDFAKCLIEDERYEFLKNHWLSKFLIKIHEYNELSEREQCEAMPQFMQKNFDIYSQLCDYDLHMLIRELSVLEYLNPCVKIAKRLSRRQLPRVITLDAIDYLSMENKLQCFLASNPQIQFWQIAVLNPPHHSYVSRDQILVIDDLGRIETIEKKSPIIQSLKDKEETTCFLCIDKDIFSQTLVNELLGVNKLLI